MLPKISIFEEFHLVCTYLTIFYIFSITQPTVFFGRPWTAAPQLLAPSVSAGRSLFYNVKELRH